MQVHKVGLVRANALELDGIGFVVMPVGFKIRLDSYDNHRLHMQPTARQPLNHTAVFHNDRALYSLFVGYINLAFRRLDSETLPMNLRKPIVEQPKEFYLTVYPTMEALCLAMDRIRPTIATDRYKSKKDPSYWKSKNYFIKIANDYCLKYGVVPVSRELGVESAGLYALITTGGSSLDTLFRLRSIYNGDIKTFYKHLTDYGAIVPTAYVAKSAAFIKLAKALRAYRVVKGLGQGELAAMIGLKLPSYSHYETGRYVLKRPRFEEILSILDSTPDRYPQDAAIVDSYRANLVKYYGK